MMLINQGELFNLWVKCSLSSYRLDLSSALEGLRLEPPTALPRDHIHDPGPFTELMIKHVTHVAAMEL